MGSSEEENVGKEREKGKIYTRNWRRRKGRAVKESGVIVGESGKGDRERNNINNIKLQGRFSDHNTQSLN